MVTTDPRVARGLALMAAWATENQAESIVAAEALRVRLAGRPTGLPQAAR